jgi:hypothetical protein
MVDFSLQTAFGLARVFRERTMKSEVHYTVFDLLTI